MSVINITDKAHVGNCLSTGPINILKIKLGVHCGIALVLPVFDSHVRRATLSVVLTCKDTNKLPLISICSIRSPDCKGAHWLALQ